MVFCYIDRARSVRRSLSQHWPRFLGRRSPQIVGAELPVTDAKIDLNKRYDIVYGAGYGGSNEKLTAVRILGYLRSDRDQTTGEYMDSRWLVVELPDGRRAYLRPRSVLWLLEAVPSSEDGGGINA